MADVKSILRQVLNVRVTATSRRNLEAAARRFELGIADVVDRMLARPEEIAKVVMGTFELAAAAPAPGSWRKTTASMRAQHAEAREPATVKTGAKHRQGDRQGKGVRRGARK